MIATFADYADFQTAVAAGDVTSMFFCPAISGVQDFSAVAAVTNTAIVLRFDAAEEPSTFTTDFPNAIATTGFAA
jgi:hypothetical protein